MCMPSPSAPPPPPPMPEPKVMTKKEIYDSTPHMVSGSKSGKKKLGKQALRTDLGLSSGGSGLNIT